MPGLGTIINVVLFSCGRSFGISGRPLHYTAHPRHAHESIGAVRPVYRPWRHYMQKMPPIDGRRWRPPVPLCSLSRSPLARSSARPSTCSRHREPLANGSSARLAVRAITSSPTLCLDFTHRVYRCHGYRGINPRRPARRLVHARPQGSAGLHHRLHHDGVARRGCIFSALPSRVPGDDHVALPARSPS